MTLDKLLVIIFSGLGIVFVYWYFLLKNEQETKVEESADIIVEGGYSPGVISIPVNKTTKLNFLRKDPSSCLEEVVIPDFKIRKVLPLNEKVTIELTPQTKGEFNFSCGMNMFHGKIVVR